MLLLAPASCWSGRFFQKSEQGMTLISSSCSNRCSKSSVGQVYRSCGQAALVSGELCLLIFRKDVGVPNQPPSASESLWHGARGCCAAPTRAGHPCRHKSQAGWAAGLCEASAGGCCSSSLSRGGPGAGCRNASATPSKALMSSHQSRLTCSLCPLLRGCAAPSCRWDSFDLLAMGRHLVLSSVWGHCAGGIRAAVGSPDPGWRAEWQVSQGTTG